MYISVGAGREKEGTDSHIFLLVNLIKDNLN